ncbi:hypothetical protein HMPREF0762_01660 [Slackia exigua ATCC 700122]|uniref:Uncharacterized protein n=1 Tax=Slackia exigua (strain ATCC 700122 / DSM 15923 / CIP 105133 / JCM 11022 / KCTC 5966 / S-7) TaxID=649764 RepID=D0WII5_SLAES|nr:hypothetical protein HMPREF0762_01660 [Slackia exigua ATCC 700122]
MHSRPAVRFTTTLVFISGDVMVEGGRRVSQARSGSLHKTRVLSKRVVRNRPTIHDLPSSERETRQRRYTECKRGAKHGARIAYTLMPDVDCYVALLIRGRWMPWASSRRCTRRQGRIGNG